MTKCKIHNLRKVYTLNGKPHEVIRGLDLEADLEEITVILGRSGCGKTTLLKILCGLEPANSGLISLPDRNKLSMVFQEPRLMSWLNVKKNINFGLEKDRINPEKTTELIRIVGLQGYEKAYPTQLSGGMQHRVALARALACEPEMILMDEPFAALDYFTRLALQQELLRIHDETGMGVIFVTHNIDEAILLGDHICIMSEGVISQEFYQDKGRDKSDLFRRDAITLKQKILLGLKA
ncbi:MAG TPA: ATP-binding cassette domain-containing protein [Anaerovoracaceae bacterium]|nr:ATP-binding cassette domain-containing protein [Anaerovoracaceae bacterium]